MTTECLHSLEQLDLNAAQEQRLASVAKALSHPARIRLLKILASRQCLGSDLVGDLGLAQSTVSEHLRILREAGFVHAEVMHPKTCYSLRRDTIEAFKSLLQYLE